MTEERKDRAVDRLLDIRQALSEKLLDLNVEYTGHEVKLEMLLNQVERVDIFIASLCDMEPILPDDRVEIPSCDNLFGKN